MKIKDMFYKEIDRDIKGVIKVGQADDENVYQELEEYVVTSELESYMKRFFNAYINGLETKTDKMGVWISGFFGSGKSHFLKILSYLLSNKQVYDKNGQQQTASSEKYYTVTEDGETIPDVKLSTKNFYISNTSNGKKIKDTILNDGNSYGVASIVNPYTLTKLCGGLVKVKSNSTEKNSDDI